ncbi:hypothetical protein MLD38_025160 [Melastoma candidum]|uniref:Uncharacterized protein n=1 Tax=Melastoma candidum TaxID=119954 RepID=A0ACB9P1D8_9MYRT|nr:hypothetical protein MLD38_025160 [Melastoma candidum]
MGGIVDGGAGIDIKTSPRQAAIEKAQAELRHEYDVRDKRRRELEFLEKGGNPLDFKHGNAASVSIQSTSLVDQHKEQCLPGDAKVSLALTASTHGDSIESSGRPGVTAACEHNSADSHVRFDGGTEVPEGDEKLVRLDRKNSVVHPDQSVKTDSNFSAKESEDSAIFRPYARRNRSRLYQDDGRPSSMDLLNSHTSHGTSLPTRSLIKDSRVLTLDSSDRKEPNPFSVSQARMPDNNDGLLSKSSTPETCLGNEVDGTSLESSITLKKIDFSVDKLNPAMRMEQHHECLTDTQKTSTGVPCKRIGVSGETEVSADGCNLPSAHSLNEDLEMGGRLKSICEIVVNDKTTVNEALNSNVAANSKALDSESSCPCSTEKVPVDPMNIDQQTVRGGETGLTGVENMAGGETANGQNNNKTLKGEADGEGDDMLWKQNCIDNVMTDQGENKSHGNFTSVIEPTPVEPKREETELLADNANANEENFPDMKPEGPPKVATSESCKNSPPERVEVADHEVASADNHSSLPATVNEDYVLEEAKIIEAKRKRIAELSIGTMAFEERHRSHWEFVLEEMAWLANDFAQERLWKSTTASQLCHRAASASCLRLKRQNMQSNHKKVAFTLAKGVMQFWGSMENNLNIVEDSGSSDGKVLRGEPADLGRDVDAEGSSGKVDPDTGQELCDNNVSLQSHRKYPLLQSYAVRFLRQTSSHVPSFQAELPEIVDVTSESDSQQVSLGDHLTEEKLFYTVPSGAMETYRKLIESYMSQREGTGNIQDPKMRMSEVCDYGYQENAYNEGGGETGTYYLPGAFEDSKSLAVSQKKRKVTTRPYEADSPNGRYAIGTQQTMGKRLSNFVGQIPTKRFRSASRPRVILPSGTAASVNSFLAPTKTDASSGDTSSFQDDQSTVPSALRMQKSGEADSVGNYGSSFSHDMAETSMTKKRRKKYSGSQFEQGWQMDSPILAEQWDKSKRRLENHHFESNGTSGLYDQPVIKKPKVMKHSADNSLDNFVTGSIPSTMASQSVSNPKKILKIFNGHDGGRKTKTLKSPSVQPGSGSSWSQFEDQALVVLVHDMGPNWELVSDAINSILKLKCVYRKPAECKEHHKVLMDKTANDGADSTEDSGSSQPYPSTLPGIPKGSARQLFQRLQGPIEEDIMREHFNKIIQIGQKQRYNKMQNESHDVKQMAVHNSHFAALSQVCPNNLNGVILTPLDLCEEDSTNADILLPHGYQGSHGNSLAATNQVSAASALPNSGTYPSLPGSGGTVCSPNLLPTSAPHNAPSRDGRYNVQRQSAPPSDEQHRGQQHDHALSSRNSQHSKLSVSGNDRGVRAFPNSNNIGIPTATKRSMMPSPKPAFQGPAGTPAMNPSSMLSSGLVGVPGSGNLHMGSNPSQATPFMRPRETLHSARPGNMEHQRQMMAPELQMQVAQGNSHGIPLANGAASGFSNQGTSPVSTFPAHSLSQQQIPPHQSPAHNRHQNTHLQGTNHSTGPQSQAYAIRLAKERQLQKRFMQQQQLPSSGSLISHVQPSPQKPLPSALPSSTQVPLQSTTQPVPPAPLTPSSPINPMIPTHVPKVPMQASGLVRNAQSSVGNQVGKQRQRQLQQHQQFQQSGRQHPQQRHLTQAPAKVPKGGGRGNAMTNQNLQNESSKINGISLALGSSAGEKDVMRGQGLISMHPVQQSKPLASQLNHPQVPPQTSSDLTPSLKQFHQQHQPRSHSDGSSQGQILPVPSGQNMHHSASSTPMGSNHLEVQLPQLTNKRQLPLTQSIGPRMAQNQVAHEPLAESLCDCKGDPSPVSNTLTVGASKGMPLASHDSSGSPPIHWQVSEPLYESGIMSATGQIGRGGNLVYSGAARSDLLSSVNQGLGPKQKLDVPSVQCQGPGLVEEQRQLQSTHSRHSSALTPSPQQPYHAVKQVSQLEQLPSKDQQSGDIPTVALNANGHQYQQFKSQVVIDSVSLGECCYVGLWHQNSHDSILVRMRLVLCGGAPKFRDMMLGREVRDGYREVCTGNVKQANTLKMGTDGDASQESNFDKDELKVCDALAN